VVNDIDILLGKEEDEAERSVSISTQNLLEGSLWCMLCEGSGSVGEGGNHLLLENEKKKADMSLQECQSCEGYIHNYCIPKLMTQAGSKIDWCFEGEIEDKTVKLKKGKEKEEEGEREGKRGAIENETYNCSKCQSCEGCGETAWSKPLLSWNLKRLKHSLTDKPSSVCGSCLVRFKHKKVRVRVRVRLGVRGRVRVVSSFGFG
jgi:hypothetical protein